MAFCYGFDPCLMAKYETSPNWRNLQRTKYSTQIWINLWTERPGKLLVAGNFFFSVFTKWQNPRLVQIESICKEPNTILKYKNNSLTERQGKLLVTDNFFFLLFTKWQNSRLVQIESICRQQNKCDCKTDICTKHCGKGENAGYRHFPLFSKCFHKAFCQGH